MDAIRRKRHGVHYTPRELALFLARQIAICLAGGTVGPTGEKSAFNRPLTILDPACGDGGLLIAAIHCLQDIGYSANDMEVVGYETDTGAVKCATKRLGSSELSNVRIHNQDFLFRENPDSRFDFVIANPPYVRTQVLGGEKSRQLARRFELDGRIDLYQAFTVALVRALRPAGVMGLLTSNRFLTVKSGAAMRQMLRSQFDLHQVIDLGDSRLFGAAVLPVIVVGTKRDIETECDGNELPPTPEASNETPSFCRIANVASRPGKKTEASMTLLEAVADRSLNGDIETHEGVFRIQRGELSANRLDAVWSLTNPETRQWIAMIRKYQRSCFGDWGEIKVGIKTTADAIFIREEWASLGSRQPEQEVLVPLLTHHAARRWEGKQNRKTVLYPYDISSSERTPVKLSEFPQARKYLEDHRERLEGRRYLIDAGRRWYEIWVPHQPSVWSQPKIVWPDISEKSKFYLDRSGAIVNGDCYWLKLRENVDPDWLYLMLGVANSCIATRFYDTIFCNKLYAGRRRFMTQYVKEFPLPDLESPASRRIVSGVKQLVADPEKKDTIKIDRLVLAAFGF